MSNSRRNPFHIKDCALATISTGIKVQMLPELRDRLTTIPLACINLHFWGGRLRTVYEHHEFHNDFSYWVHHALRDDILAERLELLDPTQYPDLEDLRKEMLEIIEERLDEQEVIEIARKEERFHFLRSKIVIFRTPYMMHEPADLLKIIPLMTRSSLFYHFIDAVRRTKERESDFTIWLRGFGEEYDKLKLQFATIDPYFISLASLQTKLIEITTNYFSEIPMGEI